MRGTVPNNVLNDPQRGFSVPCQYWLRGLLSGYLKSLLFDTEVEHYNLFEKRQIEKLIDEHLGGAMDHGDILWKALNLALWYRKYAPC